MGVSSLQFADAAVLRGRRVWDLSSGKCLRVLEGHSGRVNAVTVCDQSGAVLTASDDSTARVWDMETGLCLAVLEVREPPPPPARCSVCAQPVQHCGSRHDCIH